MTDGHINLTTGHKVCDGGCKYMWLYVTLFCAQVAMIVTHSTNVTTSGQNIVTFGQSIVTDRHNVLGDGHN